MSRASVIRISLLSLALAGCASTRPTEARQQVSDALAQRADLHDIVSPAQDEQSRARVRERVFELLRQPLTVERALQVAMLNNRELHATLEELGIAQAELVEAGLLENPTIGGDLVNSTLGNGLGGGLGLSQSLLSAFLVPAKRRLARAQLQRAVIEVTDAALALVRDVKVAHAEVQAAAAMRDLHRVHVQAAEVADELAQRQQEAGNLTELERELRAATLDRARLELAEHELTVTEARERLNRLLGLWGAQIEWTLGGPLPPLPAEAVALAELEQLGIEQRLDISAARFEVESMERALQLRRRGLIPQIEVGIEARNEVGDDEGHEWVVGPSLSIELPLFDPGHADLARLGSQLRQAQHRLQKTAIDARSQIRVERQHVLTARRRVAYLEDTVLPRWTRVEARSLERYNAMLLGAYELLELRAEALDMQQQHVQALRDYWVARAQLERSVGGRLPS